MPNARYLIYISDAKVNMLLPQVPGGIKESVEAEVGFDLGVVAGKVKSGANSLEERTARLRAVEAFIRKTESLSTPSKPTKWVHGRFRMSAANIGHGAVFYLCEGPNWVLGLAGSATHLAGGAAPQSVEVALSFLPDIAARLVAYTNDDPLKLDRFPEETEPRFLAPGVHQGVGAWWQTMDFLRTHRTAPEQQIGFLAKRLAAEEHAGRLYVLATPLYLEQLD